MSGWSWAWAHRFWSAFLTVRSLRALQPPLLQVAGNLPGQTLRINWLGNVPVAAGAEDLLAIAGHGVGGEGDDDHARHPGIGPNLAGNRQAILSRELDVHQDDVGQLARHLRQALGAAAGLAHDEAFLLQEELGPPEVDRFICDDQYLAGGHARSSFASERCPSP